MQGGLELDNIKDLSNPNHSGILWLVQGLMQHKKNSSAEGGKGNTKLNKGEI